MSASRVDVVSKESVQQRIRPSFQVERLSGTVEVEKVKWVDGRMVREIVKEPAGYMVYLPSRQSLRVRDDATLRRMNLDRDPVFIDMETGDPVALPPRTDLRGEMRRSKASKTSTDDNEEN
jgi:hypothetical protein